MSEPNASAVLDLFLPVVAEWFRRTFGEPSPVQVQGWPVIASGQHTLLVAPTGSGKTLAAFLLGLDRLWRTASETDTVRVLYVSPLRALSYDISRNLELPLREVPRVASELGVSLPRLRLAVRTGDTSSRDRGRLLRQPPHILITTPESLHLLLTSQGRQILRRVEWCIVDEWHALCPNKRGVFLTLLLERLAWWAGRDFQRVGLSATLRPVEAAASMLAGTGRSMTIVDLGQSRPLDVAVLAPAADSALLQETSVWPAIESATLHLIEQHTSTLVFTNNRRAAERMSARLRENWEVGAGDAEDPHAIPVRSHHGSLSLEVRRQTEQQLKAGQLRAVVATASLELGLDIGSVDLVCQIESPGSIWRAWQRLGRSGHRVGAVCKGRFLAKTASDLVELAALVRAMRQGILEETTTPPNCLDVLAQQIVAMVAMDAWPVAELRQVIRRAWPYRQLPDTALENVLRMLSARWPGLDSALWRPRLAWDRASDTLYPLPGSQHLALVNGGTIPDTGQYKVILADTGVVLGTLDEEFVYERRLGDVFVLGTGVWRIEDIGAQEVVVRRTSPHEPAVMPFWRGERLGRSWELGLAVGRLLRELRNRLHDRDCLDWLGRECGLEPHAARQLWDYVHRQLEQTGVVPCEDTILVEAFPDEMGDWYLAVLSPFGQRWHFTLRLALESWWKERYGCAAPAVHHDDGVLIRLLDTGELPVDVLHELMPERVEKDVLASLGSCAFFAIRFRQNAMRSLLLPRLHPQRRTPLWLQRLKARNLLQLVERCPDFPVVMETYRECLNEHLDVPRLRQVLEKIRNGEIAVRRIVHDFPSPFAAQLRFQFTGAFMYDYDRVEPAQRSPAVNVEPLRQLLAPATPESIDETALITAQQTLDFPIRSEHELAEWLRRRGDTLPDEIPAEQQPRLQRLIEQKRVVLWQIPCQFWQPQRWIAAEDLPLYRTAFGEANDLAQADGDADRPRQAEVESAWREILRRFLNQRATTSVEEIQQRYPIPAGWLHHTLQSWVSEGWLCALQEPDGNTRYVRRQLRELAARQQHLRRRAAFHEVSMLQFARFLLHWQGLAGVEKHRGVEGLRQVLRRLQGLWLAWQWWEPLLLRPRLPDYQPAWLNHLVQSGEWLWLTRSPNHADKAEASFRLGECEVAFLPRSDADYASLLHGEVTPELSAEALQVQQLLKERGASFVVDLARYSGQSPGRIRRALLELLAAGLVSNDQLDVLRYAERWDVCRDGSRRPRIGSSYLTGNSGEGRWFLLPSGKPAAELVVLWRVHVLLERYGIVCRELAEWDNLGPPWSVLRLALQQLEWAGEIYRGYFVAGLSGEQYALPEAAHLLGSGTSPATELMTVQAVDPACLAGLSTAMDAELFGEKGKSFRRLGNAMIWHRGRPVLLVESFGKKLSACEGVSPDECQTAVTALGELAVIWQPWLRGRLRVETWNNTPVLQTPAAHWLKACGFVCEYPALTLYLSATATSGISPTAQTPARSRSDSP